MSFSKILEKFDRVLTGRQSVLMWDKNWCYFSFFKYFQKSATSYTVIKNISQFFIIGRNRYLEN